MPRVVVDASLATKWVLSEPFDAEALLLLRQWERDRVQRLVPALYASEVCTPLLKRRRQGLMSVADMERGLATLLAAVTMQPLDPVLVPRAIAVADGLTLWGAYDSVYLALAERESCDLWTADERFYNAARRQVPFVRWVGEVAIP